MHLQAIFFRAILNSRLFIYHHSGSTIKARIDEVTYGITTYNLETLLSNYTDYVCHSRTTLASSNAYELR